MRGTDANTGKPISGNAHVAQSVRDILTTPVGSRVMRRDYGSDLFRLIDAPANTLSVARIAAAVGDALARWEPRFDFERVSVASLSSAGRLHLIVHGKINGEAATVTV